MKNTENVFVLGQRFCTIWTPRWTFEEWIWEVKWRGGNIGYSEINHDYLVVILEMKSGANRLLDLQSNFSNQAERLPKKIIIINSSEVTSLV